MAVTKAWVGHLHGSCPRSGVDLRIERLRRSAARDAGVIPLAGGLPAERTFPRQKLGRALVAAMGGKDSAALQYGWPEGRESLRSWVAQRLRSRGAPVVSEDVIITSGAQQALAIAVQLTCRPGQEIAVSRESYPAALELFRAHGLRPSHNLAGVAAVYAMPGIDNPRGRGLDPRERAEISRAGVPILEDDAYADLRFTGDVEAPLLATLPERVWHIGTFSKTLCPGLRVGWLVPPRARLSAAVNAKQVSDLQSSSLAQAILEHYLRAEDFDARLSRLRRLYASRAERLAHALRKHLPSFRFLEPLGGFSIWVETDDGGDDTELLSLAIQEGTSFDPGREFRAGGESSPVALRLAYSFARTSDLEEGVRRLARAWRGYVCARLPRPLLHTGQTAPPRPHAARERALESAQTRRSQAAMDLFQNSLAPECGTTNAQLLGRPRGQTQRRKGQMNWDVIQGKWKQLTGSLRQEWGKLTDDDIDVIAGDRERLLGKLQERYGYSRDQADKMVDRWLSHSSSR